MINLKNVWPDLKNNLDDGFWEMEFNLHGRCMTHQNFSQFDYFWLALDLYRVIHERSRVETAINCIPSNQNKCSLFDIEQNLLHTYGYYVQVICPVDRMDTITEVRFCFDRMNLPISCPRLNLVVCLPDVLFLHG